MKTLTDKVRRFAMSRKDFNFRFPISWLFKEIKKDENLYRKLVMNFRDELITTAETYPSLINKHERHIEKAIQLARQLNLDPLDSIVDVGARSGEFSILLAKTFSKARVYAFEPIEKNFEDVKKACSPFPNINPFKKALGAQPGNIEINVAKSIGSSSIFELNRDNDSLIFSDNLELERKEAIVISTLDNEIPSLEKINILKLDVQGYELEVLKGGTSTLKKTCIVICEVSNHSYYKHGAKYYQIDEFLRENNFALFNFFPGIVENDQIREWDCLYVRNDLIRERNMF